MELKKESYDVWDWVVDNENNIVRIVADEMPDLPFEKIARLATKDELKQAVYDGLIDVDDSKSHAFDILEKRMYFFVPYNISEIQKAIQAGHAVEQYVFEHGDTMEYYDYINNHKTWIVLNGGTTNDSVDDNGVSVGSLNQIADQLQANEINFGFFREPDLNDALTAVCFLCDERVFNWKQYPDFISWCTQKENFTKEMLTDETVINEYTKFVGGSKIKFLKELTYGKRLA